MRLHQLKVDYDAEQDRLLMLVATNEGVELRLSLTRRFVKLLWPLLVLEALRRRRQRAAAGRSAPASGAHPDRA